MNSKTTMLAAALIVGIVALAGAGYATMASSYKAVTVNENNTMESAYLVLTQDGDAKYSGLSTTGGLFSGIAYNTRNTTNAQTIEYTPIADYYTTSGSPNSYVTEKPTGSEVTAWTCVTKTLELKVDKSHSVGTSSIQLDVDISNAVPLIKSGNGLNYKLVVATTAPSSTEITAVTQNVFAAGSNSNMTTSVTLSPTYDSNTKIASLYVFVMVSGSLIDDGTDSALTAAIPNAGFNRSVGEPATTDSVFTFTVTPYTAP